MWLLNDRMQCASKMWPQAFMRELHHHHHPHISVPQPAGQVEWDTPPLFLPPTHTHPQGEEGGGGGGGLLQRQGSPMGSPDSARFPMPPFLCTCCWPPQMLRLPCTEWPGLLGASSYITCGSSTCSCRRLYSIRKELSESTQLKIGSAPKLADAAQHRLQGDAHHPHLVN